MLALSVCHSKSKVPVAVLNDPARLRQLIQHTVSTNLATRYREQGGDLPSGQIELAEMIRPAALRANLDRLYTAFDQESFVWMLSTDADMHAFIADVTDTLRALRCADALRQRGTVLKTSGSYGNLHRSTSAYAVVALRKGDDQLFLLKNDAPLAGGEANLASSELGRDGNLRISFHRGRFANAEMVERAAQFAATVVNDIQNDVIGGFERAFSPEETMQGIKAPHNHDLAGRGR